MSLFRPSTQLTAASKPAPVISYRYRPPAKPAAAAIPHQTTQSFEAPRNQGGPFHGIAFLCVLALVFIQTTFIHEILFATLQIRSYLSPVFGSLAILGLIVTGGLWRIFRYKITYLILGFTIWVIMSIGFSSWRGGSLSYFLIYFRTQLVIFFILVGVVTTWREYRMVVYTLALSSIVNEGTALWIRRGGIRLELEGVSIGNANDFSAHLLFLLPMVLFMFYSKEGSKIIQLVLLGSMVYGLFLIVSTASRGAVVALTMGYLLALLSSSGVNRFALAVAVPGIFAILLLMMPASVVMRLSTIFGNYQEAIEVSQEAVDSAIGRTHLFKESLRLTLENPLFGVGLGQFATVEGTESKRISGLGMWLETHNAYTQISSETGIPGILLFLGGLASAFFLVRKVYRQARAVGHVMIEKAAFALMLSFVCFCTAAFFLSLAYRSYFPSLMGLAVALSAVSGPELRRMAAAPAQGRGLKPAGMR